MSGPRPSFTIEAGPGSAPAVVRLYANLCEAWGFAAAGIEARKAAAAMADWQDAVAERLDRKVTRRTAG